MLEKSVVSYDVLGEEYYDSRLHPTCADFRELSRLYIGTQLKLLEGRDRDVIEVGSGRSLAAELMSELGMDLGRLTITDASQAMLRHSADWEKSVAEIRVLDATKIAESGVRSDVLIASLADPYNTPAFWQGVKAALNPHGLVIFTTPSFDWADNFRSAHGLKGRHLAEFKSPKFGSFFVDSNVISLSEQIAQMCSAGLVVVDFKALGWSKSQPEARSRKIKDSPFYRTSVVWGFVATCAP
jgi:hypothetical protein